MMMRWDYGSAAATAAVMNMRKEENQTHFHLPLSNRRIAFTTPSTYASRLACLLKLQGSTPIWCPTVLVQSSPQTKASLKSFLQNQNQNENENALLEGFSAIAFTSRTGIAAFSDVLAEVGPPPPLSGEGDAFMLSALGRDTELLDQAFVSRLCVDPKRITISVPSVATPAFLAESIGPGLGRQILCPAPLVVDLQEPPVIPDFLQDLTSRGWAPVKALAYETRWGGPNCGEALLQEETSLDAIIFTSTAEVEGLLKSLRHLGFGWRWLRERWPSLVVAAHGPVTASGAERLGVSIDVTSSRFGSFDGVVEALSLKWGDPVRKQWL